jgi:hypothetical protein
MENNSAGIRIVVINGSVRPGNYTSMASALVVDELRKDPKLSVHLINPATIISLSQASTRRRKVRRDCSKR